jgi:hypothetical protein
MTKNFLYLSVFVVLASQSSAFAQFPFNKPVAPSSPLEMPKGEEKPGVWVGYLIDTENMKACALKIDPKDCLTNYAKETALSTKRPSFLLYANNSWYALDKNGSKLARQYIEKASQVKGFFVAIKGASLGHTITVENIDDASNTTVK